MTIEEYISETRQIRNRELETNISETLAKQFDSLIAQTGLKHINLVVIDSLEAECSTVHIGNEYYIIWDISYWNCVENYLNAAAICSNHNEQLAHTIYNFLLYKLLEDRTRKPIAKKALANMCDNMFNEILHSNYENLTATYNNSLMLELFKYFVFIHELNHIQFKENEALKSTALKEMEKYISILTDKQTNFFDNDLLFVNSEDKENINSKKAIKQYLDDDKIKLEIICDFYALKSLITSYKLNGLGLDDEVIIDFLCLKDAVIGYYDDVLYYEHYINRLVDKRTPITKEILQSSAKGLYDKANLFLSREVLFTPIILAILVAAIGRLLNIESSKFYDMYNKLNHNALRNKNMLDFVNRYNDLLKQ